MSSILDQHAGSGTAVPQAVAAESPTSPACAAAARVLRMEADALVALADGLDGAFDRAVALLDAVKGRVVVTGMGKSGHVARKIAATLASTGSPAFFVHPGEASHGDLGMVTAADAVIALSNSGETAELSDMVAYTRRYGIPLVGITRRRGSALAEQSDVALVLPAAPEACPLSLAPTTSTTMMLALGDALAVALMERRGFSAADFHQLHPGGSLGKALLKVSDVMHKGDGIPLCAMDAPLSEVVLEMTAKRLGCVGVVDEKGDLTGIVTDGDLRRHMNPHLLTQKAGDLMSQRPKTIRSRALVAEALRVMNEKAITSLFVVDPETGPGRPLGIVHIHDCLRAGAA